VDFSDTALARCDIKRELERAVDAIQSFMLLRRLRKWIPALLNMHELLQTLCTTPMADDRLRHKLTACLDDINSSWTVRNMTDVSLIVTDIKGVFERYSDKLLTFMSCLGSAPDVTTWLLTQNSTEEFNRLLQVVRPCTDEPRLLSAIASLVHVRTLLLQPLYAMPMYDDLAQLFDGFSLIDVGSNSDSDAVWHINNLASSFDALMDVFQRQTVSPGIKSCYSLQEIKERGKFVFVASTDSNKVLSVEISAMSRSSSTGAGTKSALSAVDESDASLPPGEGSRVESIEYLIDLRSKLLMTEIPQELEEQLNASVMIEAFVQQFQILCEMRDVLVRLCTSGHISYQDNYTKKIPFSLDGLQRLQADYEELLEVNRQWGQTVKKACEKYYFLNFFTMREILRLRSLVLDAVNASASSAVAVSAVTPPPPPPPPKPSRNPPPPPADSLQVHQMMQMGFPREWAQAALNRCEGNVERAVEYCFSNSQLMDRLAAEEEVQGSARTAAKKDATKVGRSAQSEDTSVDEVSGLLHLISSGVSRSKTREFIEAWRGDLSSVDDTSFLSTLGAVLGKIFGTKEELESARVGRRLSLPASDVAHRADTLIHVSRSSVIDDDDTMKRVPVFVTQTENPERVIDCVLSIYIRRGRMPEPGEILFCTPDSTIEELNLILMRFISARRYGRGDCVFCIADLHVLSYSHQCTLVESLRTTLREYGQADAATLVLISGLPRQVIRFSCLMCTFSF
jgi:hypothetical protein